MPSATNSGPPSSSLITLRQLLALIAPAIIDNGIMSPNDTASLSFSTQQKMAYEQLQQAAFIELPTDPPVSLADQAFLQFCLDSRQLQKGDVFVLLKSHSQPIERSTGYLKQAVQQAAFIIAEIDLTPYLSKTDATVLNVESVASQSLRVDVVNGCPVVTVTHIRSILGSLIQTALYLMTQAQNLQSQQPISLVKSHPNNCTVESAYGLPTVAAVTGTNGKTTVTQLLAQLCQQAGIDSAVMGTAGNGRLTQLQQALHTTGDILSVQKFLRRMADEQVTMVALEASSHGLDQQRLQAVPISVAIYTNLSREHLDYHRDMADYAAAKAHLFNRQQFVQLTHAIINIEDEYAPVMLEAAADSGLTVWTYGIQAQTQASFVARQIQPSLQGTTIEIDSPFGLIWVDSPLLGQFNVANLLAAVAGALAMGVDIKRIPALVKRLHGAKGRMQRVSSQTDNKRRPIELSEALSGQVEPCVIVDYAHTPDALQQVLTSLQAHCDGQLWAVFGCGGNRDTGKRPIMAQAGLTLADQVVLTSDNPRKEDPNTILKDMQVGITAEQQQKVRVEPDRKKAIYYAIENAKPNDIVVIAGKGHETYQEINGVRYDFDDALHVQAALHTYQANHSDLV